MVTAAIIAVLIMALAFLCVVSALSHTANPGREEVELSRMERNQAVTRQEVEGLRIQLNQAICDRERQKGRADYWKAQYEKLKDREDQQRLAP